MSMLQLLRSSGGTRNGSGSSGTPAAAVSEAATSSDDAAAAAHTGALPAGAPSALQFRLPVDHEHKATALPLLSVARPHMAAFHLSWACLFVSFMTTFAPAALLPVLQDALDLTRTDISNAGVASVCGTIFSRVAMGALTDVLGPRYSAAVALLGTAPLMFGLALARTAAAFIALRMLVGLGLSMFVVNQAWMGEMFNRSIVGRATALSAGWGNTGFGVTLLLMPLLYDGFASLLDPAVAWRAAFFVPGGLQLLAGVLVLVLADDTPEGRLPQLNRRWCRGPCCGCGGAGVSGWRVVVANPRPYLLAAAYAACFGVEITIANIVSLYLFNQFHLSLTAAGLLGGSLGLLNVVSRFLGGAGSDLAAGRRGMRGRMWVLLVLLLLEGVFCLLVGITRDSLGATLATLFACSFFGQMACGAVFGIVPFASHRSSGLTVGLVAAGGNVGSAVMQVAFFGSTGLTPYEGFYWMGTAVICLGTLACLGLYWPMWGGLCWATDPDVTEEKFYLSEYSSAQRAAGAHLQVLAFAHEAHSERDPKAQAATWGRLVLPCSLAWCGCCCHRSAASGSKSASGGDGGSADADAGADAADTGGAPQSSGSRSGGQRTEQCS